MTKEEIISTNMPGLSVVFSSLIAKSMEQYKDQELASLQKDLAQSKGSYEQYREAAGQSLNAKDDTIYDLQQKVKALEAEKQQILQTLADTEDLNAMLRGDDNGNMIYKDKCSLEAEIATLELDYTLLKSDFNKLKQAFEDLLERFCKLNEEHTGRHRNIKPSWLTKAGLTDNN